MRVKEETLRRFQIRSSGRQRGSSPNSTQLSSPNSFIGDPGQFFLYYKYSCLFIVIPEYICKDTEKRRSFGSKIKIRSLRKTEASRDPSSLSNTLLRVTGDGGYPEVRYFRTRTEEYQYLSSPSTKR